MIFDKRFGKHSNRTTSTWTSDCFNRVFVDSALHCIIRIFGGHFNLAVW